MEQESERGESCYSRWDIIFVLVSISIDVFIHLLSKCNLCSLVIDRVS